MFEKAGIVARSCRSGIRHRGASAFAENDRIDTQRGATPIGVRMQVNQAGGDNFSLDILDRCSLCGQSVPYSDHFSRLKGHIGDPVNGL